MLNEEPRRDKSSWAIWGLATVLMTSGSLANSVAATQSLGAPIVRTESGPIQGVRDGDIEWFKGVPFAAPPVGALRWQAPQAVKAWEGVRRAETFAFDCASNMEPSTISPLRVKQSEDCLYLNIWKPVHAQGPLPVLVWIYGGGFTNGGTSPANYDGANLARQGVLLLSFNYRVGQLGFFAHPALAQEQAGQPRGNYGFLDQIAALKWIRRNIAPFGGDPKNVTVFGESAGGFSVHMLLISPLAQGLIDKAIAQSGGGRRTQMEGQRMSDDGTGKRRAAEKTGLAWAKSHGIDGTGPAALTQLRALPTAAVLEGITMVNPLYSGPMIDGTIVPYNMMTAYDSGRFAHIPLMIGTTTGDMTKNHAQSKDELFAAFGDHAARARAVYDPNGQTALAEIRAEEGADQMMHETARFTARRFTEAHLPVYLYRFGYVAAMDRPGAESSREKLGLPHAASGNGATTGAYHASEIPFVFDTLSPLFGEYATVQDRTVAKMMSGYWVAFAQHGDPNGGGRPAWKPYAPTTGELLIIDEHSAVMKPDPWKDRLDVAERLNLETAE